MLDAFAGAEVCQFHDAFVIDQDIAALDIAMGRLSLVQKFQSLKNLSSEHSNERFFKGAESREQRGDGAASCVF